MEIQRIESGQKCRGKQLPFGAALAQGSLVNPKVMAGKLINT